MSKDADYYAINPDEFEALDDSDKEAVFDGETIADSDTGKQEEGDSQNPDNTETSETLDAGSNDGQKEQTLMAKDGEHTIPFSQLTEARERADAAELLNIEQGKVIKAFEDAQTSSDSTSTNEETVADFIDNYEGDYPEIAEEMKGMFEKMLDERVDSIVSEKVAPLEERSERSQAQENLDFVVDKVPDAIDVYKSDGFKDWINNRPLAVRDLYIEKAQAGVTNPNDIVSILDEYKSTLVTNSASAGADTESVTEKAKSIIDGVKTKPPGSMSDIPAGVEVASDPTEALLNGSAQAQAAIFEGKTPMQIQQMLDQYTTE